jgi:Tol biopolymer transport system component
MKRCVGLLAVVGLAILAGSGTAGNYAPPPGDCCPQWSPNGTQIVFAGNRGQGQTVGAVAVSGGRERFVPGIPVGVRSPDWTSVAYVDGSWLAVARVDGAEAHRIVEGYGGFAWSPDSKRIAVVTATGFIDVAGADGAT